MYSKDIFKIISRKSLPQVHSQEDNGEKLGRSSELAYPIEIFFKFVYYLCGCPFRFVKGSPQGNGLYSRKVWRPQQAVCAFLHILCVFRLVSQVREAIPNSNSGILKNPSPYFDLLLECSAFFFKTVTMKRFWCNDRDYLRAINCILKQNHLPLRNKLTTKPAFLYLLYGFFVMKIFARLVSGSTFVVPVDKWSPSWWYRRLVAQSRYVFCFSAPYKSSYAPDLESLTFWDGLLAFLMILTQFERCVMSEFADQCLLSVSLTLWTTASSFAEDIKDQMRAVEESDDELYANGQGFPHPLVKQIQISNGQDGQEEFWSRIYRQFQAIQNLSEKVNLALGSQVTWYLAEGLFYYSIHMNVLFITKDMFQRINSIIFFVLTFSILYICADICSQMESLKSWLVKRDNIKVVPPEQAYLVLHEVISKEIGVRGNNAFTITLSMVAGYLSLIVTFFVICVQESDLKMKMD